ERGGVNLRHGGQCTRDLFPRLSRIRVCFEPQPVYPHCVWADPELKLQVGPWILPTRAEPRGPEPEPRTLVLVATAATPVGMVHVAGGREFVPPLAPVQLGH